MYINVQNHFKNKILKIDFFFFKYRKRIEPLFCFFRLVFTQARQGISVDWSSEVAEKKKKEAKGQTKKWAGIRFPKPTQHTSDSTSSLKLPSSGSLSTHMPPSLSFTLSLPYFLFSKWVFLIFIFKHFFNIWRSVTCTAAEEPMQRNGMELKSAIILESVWNFHKYLQIITFFE